MRRSFLLFAAGLMVGLLPVGAAMAVEPICPGGATARSDIVWCSDYDNLTHCTTGQEDLCWQDNHYTRSYGGTPFGLVIAKDGGAVGTGYIRAHPTPGGTGTGGGVLEPVFSPSVNAVNFRYYLRYKNGFLTFAEGGHNVQIEGKNSANTCFSALKFQHQTYQLLTYYPMTCGVGSFYIPPNQPNLPMIHNNRWYLIEVHAAIDTACTNTASVHGCNGVVRVWIDEQLITEYTDLNLGGVVSGIQFGWRFIMPELYYHAGVPPWSPETDWDNVAVSNTGTYIGPAAGENPRGTPDMSSPYGNVDPYEAWLGRHPAGDCSVGGYLGPHYSQQYRSGASLQSSITHGLYVNGCIAKVSDRNGQIGTPPVNTLYTITDGATATDCTVGGGSNQHNCVWNGSAWVFTTATDNALQVTLAGNSDGGGVLWWNNGANFNTFIFPSWSSYGWIYLPSSNNYTVTNLALSGFTNNNNPTQGYVALSVSGGKWAVDQKNTSGSHAALVSNTNVTFDTWHEYELMIWNDNTVSLMIDRARVYTKQALPLSASWAFGSGGTFGAQEPSAVVGIIDFQGTAPFTAYFDDNGIKTVSSWSCDGWGAASCPFGASLAAPANLVVK